MDATLKKLMKKHDGKPWFKVTGGTRKQNKEIALLMTFQAKKMFRDMVLFGTCSLEEGLGYGTSRIGK